MSNKAQDTDYLSLAKVIYIYMQENVTICFVMTVFSIFYSTSSPFVHSVGRTDSSM